MGFRGLGFRVPLRVPYVFHWGSGSRVSDFGFWELSIFRVESSGSGFQFLEVRVYVWFRVGGFRLGGLKFGFQGLGVRKVFGFRGCRSKQSYIRKAGVCRDVISYNASWLQLGDHVCRAQHAKAPGGAVTNPSTLRYISAAYLSPLHPGNL